MRQILFPKRKWVQMFFGRKINKKSSQCLLLKTDQIVSQLRETYVTNVRKDLKKALDLLSNHEMNKKEVLILKELQRIAHDLKGQGAQFGYPELSAKGKILQNYIQKQKKLDNQIKNTILSSLNSIMAVLEQNGVEKINDQEIRKFKDKDKR